MKITSKSLIEGVNPNMDENELEKKTQQVESLIETVLKEYKLTYIKNIYIDMPYATGGDFNISINIGPHFAGNSMNIHVEPNSFSISNIEFNLSGDKMDIHNTESTVKEIMTVAMILHKKEILDSISLQFKHVFDGKELTV